MNRNDRAITAFVMLGHAAFHTFELAIPIFVAVWLDAFSVSPAVLGTVVGAGYALVGIGALPAGVLSDSYSSKRLILGSMAGMGCGFLVVGLSPGLPWLAVGLVVWGTAASVYHPAGLSLISRGTERRGTALAYHGAAGNVGVVFGPLLAAVLLSFFGWRTVATLLVVPVAIAVLVGTRVDFHETAGVEDSDHAAGDGGSVRTLQGLVTASVALFSGWFLVVFAIANVYGLYYRGLFTFLPEVLGRIPLLEPVLLGGREFAPGQYVYAGLLLLGGVGQYVGGTLVDRVRSETALVVVSGVLLVLPLAFLPAANAGFVPLLVVAGLLGVFVFMAAPIYQDLIATYAPADHHGVSYGYTYLATFGVGALGASLAGVVLVRFEATGLFALIAGLAGVVLLLATALLARPDDPAR